MTHPQEETVMTRAIWLAVFSFAVALGVPHPARGEVTTYTLDVAKCYTAVGGMPTTTECTNACAGVQKCPTGRVWFWQSGTCTVTIETTPDAPKEWVRFKDSCCPQDDCYKAPSKLDPDCANNPRKCTYSTKHSDELSSGWSSTWGWDISIREKINTFGIGLNDGISPTADYKSGKASTSSVEVTEPQEWSANAACCGRVEEWLLYFSRTNTGKAKVTHKITGDCRDPDNASQTCATGVLIKSDVWTVSVSAKRVYMDTRSCDITCTDKQLNPCCGKSSTTGSQEGCMLNECRSCPPNPG